MSPVVVVEYDPEWPGVFEQLRARIWPAISDLATAIEHVGSTSVPGLAAKPIVDLTVVVPAADDVPAAIERLAALGYEHQGNLGVAGREAFRSPASTPRHHLYLCAKDGLALRNHLTVRDHLRTHPDVARRYGDLKKSLARQFPEDVDAYTRGKTEMLVGSLEAAGLGSNELDAIRRVNQLRNEPRVTSFAPQFLVDDLQRSITYYRKIGFTFGEPWDGFYAIGYVDGLELHLKEAPKSQEERRHRREHEHLDAAAGVDGIEAFYERCVASGATIAKPLAATPWGTIDFYLEDPDGHIISFGGRPDEA